MAMKFKCSCGKLLSVQESLAGKTGTCPACGGRIAIPKQQTERQPARGIKVGCACGKIFMAPAKFAGKMVKCPNCGDPVVIPLSSGLESAAVAPVEGQGDSLMPQAEAEVEPTPAEHKRTCPNCGSLLLDQAVVCVQCGTDLRTGQGVAAAGQRPMKRYLVPAAALVIIVAAAGGFLFWRSRSCDMSPSEVINFAETQKNAWQDVSAHMRFEASLMGKSISGEGEVYYKQPNLSRSESKSSGMGTVANELTVCDGKVRWREADEGGQITVTKMRASIFQGLGEGLGGSNPFAVQTVGGMVDWQSVRKGKVGGVPVYVLKGKLKASSIPQGMFGKGSSKKITGKFTYYIGQEDGFPYKLETSGSGGNKSKVQYSNVRLNTGLANDLFTYQPPAGAKVLDLTGGSQETQGMVPGGAGFPQ